MKKSLLIIMLILNAVIVISAVKPVLKNDSVQNWELVFEDEFNGNAVDWRNWSDEYLPGLKHGSYSQPANAEVAEGELRLYIRKESVKGSTWTAASIFLNEPIKPYTYVECKMKPTQCTGVNNAFWMANRSKETTTWKNRVEIDMVETRLDTTKNMGNCHIGWHDWKAQPYLLNAKGQLDHVAQGKIIYHDFDKYEIWGIYFRENDYVIYHNGEPVWDGKTHHIYPKQYYTGTGRFPDWFEKEGKRAYGKWGQDDWNYQAGYSGDNLNVILTAYTWPEKWSPITDAAADKYMAVDYVRLYRPQSLLKKKPEEHFPEVKRAILLKNNYSLSRDGNYYFSAVVEKKSDAPIQMAFADSTGIPVFSVGSDSKNQLFIKFGDRTSHTQTAYPAATLKKVYLENNKKYWLVVRVSALKGKGVFDRDAVSMSAFPLDGMPVGDEPYFYPNIDSLGNTSINAGWDINAKNYTDASIRLVQLRGDAVVSDFRAGTNYRSVLPPMWQGPVAVLSGCRIVAPNTPASVNVTLSGKAPWNLKYTVNGVQKELTSIRYNTVEITETARENLQLKLSEVTDADGTPGFTTGDATVLVLNDKNQRLLPSFDTFIQPEQKEDFSSRLGLEIKGDKLYERQAYISFDITKVPSGKRSFLSLYCTKNDKKLPMKLSLQYVDVPVNAALRFINKPTDEKCIEIARMEVPADEKIYLGTELTNEINYLKQLGAKTMNLRLVYVEGEKTNMVSFQQGHGQVGTNPVQLIFTDL
ncbi:MAG: family 16 glycosylhydrolase [Paludibacter sp.]|nr:family 16 glycosylhydrolase [Paludibacter sp.]